jgi:hypothetical protein
MIPGLSAPSNPQNPATSRQSLPFIHYASYKKDADLRKKMGALGIPTFGSRTTLERRHTFWVNLWNANVDAGDAGKSTGVLLRELADWDRAQMAQMRNDSAAGLGGGGTRRYAEPSTGGQATENGQGPPNAEQESERREWTNTHKDQFQDLAAQARASLRREKEKALTDAKREAATTETGLLHNTRVKAEPER